MSGQAEFDFSAEERAADLTGCFDLWWEGRQRYLATRCPLCLTEPLEARCKAFWLCGPYSAACALKGSGEAARTLGTCLADSGLGDAGEKA